jgi:CDP-paratose 2-epimerase
VSVVIVTGSCGLIGSEAAAFFLQQGREVVGIDNDMRRVFFGDEASTDWVGRDLRRRFPTYRHHSADIRDRSGIESIFRRYGGAIDLVIHTAAQPSHDWAARDPEMDFTVNANGTLVLLESTRLYAPDAVFLFTSTNKVYGDTPNRLPLVELETRWEIDKTHAYYARGIDETMSLDQTTHSVFGASKVAADVMVQEYGRYFGMRTACFRGGCLTGPNHSGAMLHGFLAYLVKCVCTGTPYKVFGYKGKQVRDNIHSSDVIAAFHEFYCAPRSGEVYNMGGGRFSNCSMLEAIAIAEQIAGRKLDWSYEERARIGDHIWYVSDCTKFASHYPAWRQKYDLHACIRDIYEHNVERWNPRSAPAAS